MERLQSLYEGCTTIGELTKKCGLEYAYDPEVKLEGPGILPKALAYNSEDEPLLVRLANKHNCGGSCLEHQDQVGCFFSELFGYMDIATLSRELLSTHKMSADLWVANRFLDYRTGNQWAFFRASSLQPTIAHFTSSSDKKDLTFLKRGQPPSGCACSLGETIEVNRELLDKIYGFFLAQKHDDLLKPHILAELYCCIIALEPPTRNPRLWYVGGMALALLAIGVGAWGLYRNNQSS